jgi:hypothetical protein
LTVVSPTVIASEATTKNQPPDIDIIVFQIRPGAANGTSSRQKRSHGESLRHVEHLPARAERQPILRCQDCAWPMKSNTTVSDSSAGAKVSACACSVGAATTKPIAYR